MKAKEVHYERKFYLGDYESETIGIVVSLDDGEKAADALAVARKLVTAQSTKRPKAQSSSAVELEKQILG